LRVGASVGIANWPGDGGSARRLFDTADRALYAAKAAGRPDMSPVESIGIAS
jgi:predicted signal transduction protein with EAL and GGDEF domain